MKILQTFEHELKYIYVRPDLEGRENSTDFIGKCLRLIGKVSNPKTLHIYGMTVFNVECLVLFICWGAKSFEDYSETAYALAMVLVTASGLKLFESAKMKLFEIIENFEHVMEKRR